MRFKWRLGVPDQCRLSNLWCKFFLLINKNSTLSGVFVVFVCCPRALSALNRVQGSQLNIQTAPQNGKKGSQFGEKVVMFQEFMFAWWADRIHPSHFWLGTHIPSDLKNTRGVLISDRDGDLLSPTINSQMMKFLVRSGTQVMSMHAPSTTPTQRHSETFDVYHSIKVFVYTVFKESQKTRCNKLTLNHKLKCSMLTKHSLVGSWELQSTVKPYSKE